ncbi:hypothetical protein DEO72_LG2g1309 [Vigna unguiculata]|uniref:Uncharacterized protein n=1 Tax=Vigna unguiculata TaxID=3917 RepID=A0A4D6KX64_VIGUN|nr:hypothetical protein DEO72_LG2g1309 [Vigna unguiculata]
MSVTRCERPDRHNKRGAKNEKGGAASRRSGLITLFEIRNENPNSVSIPLLFTPPPTAPFSRATNNTTPALGRASGRPRMPTTTAATVDGAAGARHRLDLTSSFLLQRARDGPDPGAPPSHTMPLQPRVRQLRPPRLRMPPRRHCRSRRDGPRCRRLPRSPAQCSNPPAASPPAISTLLRFSVLV